MVTSGRFDRLRRRLGRAARHGGDGAHHDADRVPDATGPTGPIDDTEVRHRLEVDGYVRLGQVLPPDDVARARAVFDEVERRLDRPLGDAWFPTILLPEDDVRAFITQGLEEIVTPHLRGIPVLTEADLMRLDFSVKPASTSSELGPHQDFSLVDERTTSSLYLWIALEDMDRSNGTLHVVPGSHRFCNRVRSQHVPATFDEVLDLVHEQAVCLDCRAGEAVLMRAGVVHFSPPNTGGSTRLAAHGIFTPAGVPLVFYYADDATPEGSVECYEFGIDDYVKHIHQGRPVGLEPSELVERPPSSMTRERFLRGLADRSTSS